MAEDASGNLNQNLACLLVTSYKNKFALLTSFLQDCLTQINYEQQKRTALHRLLSLPYCSFFSRSMFSIDNWDTALFNSSSPLIERTCPHHSKAEANHTGQVLAHYFTLLQMKEDTEKASHHLKVTISRTDPH